MVVFHIVIQHVFSKHLLRLCDMKVYVNDYKC